jgi:hypothetical protein
MSRRCIRDQCRNVPHDLSQLAGIDLVEEAVEFYVFGDRRAGAKQFDIIFDRLLVVGDGQAIVIKQRRDIGVVMIAKLVEEDLGRESGCPAKRVVNHNNVLNVEQEVHFRDRHENGCGTAASVGRGKHRPRRTNPVAGFVENHFTGVDLIPQIRRDRLRDIDRARVKAVNHQGLHWNGKVESVEFGLIEPGLRPVFVFAVLSHFPLHRRST